MTTRLLGIVNGVLLLALVLFSVLAWPSLPERIPLHLGWDGRPDRWGPKSFVGWFGLPLLAVALSLLFAWLGRVLPRRPQWVNLPDFRRASDLPEPVRGQVLVLVTGFLGLVQAVMLLIFCLVQFAMYRAGWGRPAQGLLAVVSALAVLSGPFLFVVLIASYRAVVKGRTRPLRGGGLDQR